MPIIIEAKDISKSIDNAYHKVSILNSISININKREFISIMGPSGSGKSTLLNILGGLDSQYEGGLTILGQSMQNLNGKEMVTFRRQHIGMIFQDFNLIESMTVEENLKLPLLFSRIKNYGDEKIGCFLNKVGMYEKRREKCSLLSGGEKQRTAIARALMLEPELILADEPTGSLDSKNGHKVMDLLRRINEDSGTTIVVVTHDQNMAEYGEKILLLKDGTFI